MLHNILWGVIPAAAYLVGHVFVDRLRERPSAKAQVRRSVHKVPVSQVPAQDQGAQLRTAVFLVQQLAGNGELGLSTREGAEAWLKSCNESGADESELLQQACVLLSGIEAVHSHIPSLSPESARGVKEWLDQYYGTEERR